MAQMKRKDFAHFVNTTPDSTATYVKEGIGVEALSIDYNPQMDTFKSILDEVASNTFQGYQMQSSVSDKRIDKTDDMWTFLNGLRKKSMSIETDLIETDMTTLNSGSYDALKYNITIVLNNFLGENATISYDIYINGTPIEGKTTITSGVPSFTPSVN